MGCCGGALRTQTIASAPVDTSDWALLQYNGSAQSPILFTSHETGNVYRACRGRLEQILVRPEDVEYLLARGFSRVAITDPEPEPTKKAKK